MNTGIIQTQQAQADTSYITVEEHHYEDIIPEPVPVRTTCTKYQLVCALRENHSELLEILRNAYASSTDLQFWWNTVQELDRTNADFKDAQEALGMTDEQVEAIFAEIDSMPSE